jgi:hypothetical protein
MISLTTPMSTGWKDVFEEGSENGVVLLVVRARTAARGFL